MARPAGSPADVGLATCPHLGNGQQFEHVFLGITNGKPVFQRNQPFANVQRVIHPLAQSINSCAYRTIQCIDSCIDRLEPGTDFRRQAINPQVDFRPHAVDALVDLRRRAVNANRRHRCAN